MKTSSTLGMRFASAVGKSATSGFTLIELLVTISVAAILLAIAVPSFNDATLGSKLGSYANNLVAGTLLARSEAIKRNTPVTLCVSTDGSSCASGGWEQGWVVLAGTAVVQRQQALLTGIKGNGSVATLTFQPSGLAATAATVTFCRATPSVGAQERVVTITAAGQASVTRTTTGSCP
jgi:type IV fimbrial biogenesis protein FimT